PARHPAPTPATTALTDRLLPTRASSHRLRALRRLVARCRSKPGGAISSANHQWTVISLFRSFSRKKSFPKSYSASVTFPSEIQLPCTVIVGGFFGDEGKDDANRPLEAR